MSERVGVAVVGAGGWGFNHVRTFSGLDSAELRWVCDLQKDALARVEREQPGPRLSADFTEPLADPKVRGVVIASDAQAHHALAERALEAGKDVLVEKPLTLSSATALALVEKAERLGRMLMVGHLLLFHPAVLELRARLSRGELGELLYLTCQRINLGIVRSNENAWWSLAPHDISLANTFMDAAPLSVSATAGGFLQRQRGIEDVVFATLTYPGGRLAHVHVSWLDPHKTRRLTLVGARKMAVFDDGLPAEKLRIFDKRALLPETEGQPLSVHSGASEAPAIPSGEPLKLEAEAFLESIRSRRPTLADGRAGLAVVRVLEAGDRSIAAGGAAVSVETK